MGRGLGATLDAVKTTDSVLTDERDVVCGWAHSGLRGWRTTMEDSVVAHRLSPHARVFAVFDGHGGSFCSAWAAEQLPRRLKTLAKLQYPAPTKAKEVHFAATSLGDTLRQMDDDLRREGRKAWSCGSTAVALLVTPRYLTVANLGDSRAVLCRKGNALPMSKDHKPRSSNERCRILQAGGCIIDGRVNGDLALSRALGDFRHKSVPGLAPSEQPVSSDPEMRCVMRLREDRFLLLACDGVWDVMSSSDAVEFVGACFVQSTRRGAAVKGEAADEPSRDAPHETEAAKAAVEREALRAGLGTVCELLLDECLRRGSTDNISVVLVLLDPNLVPRRDLKRPSAKAPKASLSIDISQHGAPAASEAVTTRARGLRRVLFSTCLLFIAFAALSGQQFFRSEVLTPAPRRQVGLKFADGSLSHSHGEEAGR
ncbi:hypothetical protein AB1Y20_022881 [Prymnesium parvum]|uniref:protein-serine/threonine phosphatase n=1 Tax=Prymnesium parvum TaxID=97485 RepID=A0AB34JEN5_PRYPA